QVGTTRIVTQGTLTQTDNKLNVAINGRGYFGVTLPSGDTAYTRDGSFQKSATGQLVTNEGYQVEPNITIDPTATDVTINQAGQVIVTAASGKQSTVGQLHLFNFANESGLEAIGGNNFMETDASGSPNQGVPADAGY